MVPGSTKIELVLQTQKFHILRINSLSKFANLSVVGSGPILIPGKSCSRRYLMNVVFPVEY